MHTIVSWPNPKQWVIVHTSDLMMTIRQSIYILSIITKEMGKLKTHSPTYCIMDNWDNMLNLTHTRQILSDRHFSMLSKLCLEPDTFIYTNYMHMMMSSNWNLFRVTGPLCEGFTGRRWISSRRPVTRSFDVLFDLCLNKQLCKQSERMWFETPPCSLWRHCNELIIYGVAVIMVK